MKHTLLPIQALVIFLSLIGLTFYTVDRIRTDFQFIHGESLSWINAQGVKTAIFLVSVRIPIPLPRVSHLPYHLSMIVLDHGRWNIC